MTWIYSSFLVTPCTFTSCHVVISKQGDESGQSSQVQQVCNGRGHVITTRSDLDWVQGIGVEQGTRSRSEASLTSLQGGASVGTPWLPEEDMGRSPLSEYMYGEFYNPRKSRFIPTFFKRINRTSTAVRKWLTAFEERGWTTFSVTKFIYNNNNKQGFTPNGTNN